jgi:hypothetical protein
VWQTEVICALSASGAVSLSRTLSTYRVSGNGGGGGGGGGDSGGGRQADYAICKNRSRGIPFVIRQEQPCVIRRRGTEKEILRNEDAAAIALLRTFEINILNRCSGIFRHSRIAIEFLI